MSNKNKLQVQQNNALRVVKYVRKCSLGTEIRKDLRVPKSQVTNYLSMHDLCLISTKMN